MKLSIITITRNDLDGLRRTALSVSSQSFRDYEWIVIDGASTDGTVEYLQSMQPQPSAWVSEPDGGVYDAMNKGIQKAQGEYLLFLNSGDSLLAPDTLARCFSAFPNADIVYGDAYFVYPKRKKIVTHPDTLNLYYFRRHSLCHQATFIRASLLRECGYSTQYKIVSDWRQWLVWMIEGRSFVHLPIVVCNYMMDGVSTTMRKASGIEREAVFREVLPSVWYDLMIAEETIYQQKKLKYLRVCYLLGALVLLLSITLILICL